jgi:hypothetical protein
MSGFASIALAASMANGPAPQLRAPKIRRNPWKFQTARYGISYDRLKPHQWGNPGSEPLTFLAFNINPEGVPAVVPEAPTRP